MSASRPYAVQTELKSAMDAAGVDVRDIATLLGEAPKTTSGRLNGHGPLHPHHEKAIREAIAAKKAEGAKA